MRARHSRFNLAGMAGIAMLLAAACSNAATDVVGQPAPAFIAKQLDGTTLDLATTRGKVVVVNFWASWCTPCRAEMPMLEAFFRKHQAEGVLLVGLSADDRHDRADVVRAAAAVTYPIALLQDAKVNGFGSPAALPMTFVIDASGFIRARLAPTRAGLSEQQLAAVVLPLLAAAGDGGSP